MIKQAKTLFKINFLQEIQYRTAAFAGIITQWFFGLMHIMIFSAFINSGAPGDFSVVQMSTYIWLQQAFYVMFGFFDPKKEISQSIVKGDIVYQMVKPMSIYSYWALDVYSTNLSKMLWRFLPVLIIAILLPAGWGLSAPISLAAFFVFLLSLFLGSILIVAVKIICYTLVLYTMSPYGVFGFMVAFAGFLAGSIVPIPMLPQGFAQILNFFPFRYITDLPFRVYVGNIGTREGLIQVGIQVAWIIVLYIIGKLLLKRKLKSLVVQGG